MDRQQILTLAFLVPADDDFAVNRLTARVSTHPFCHAELFFESVNQCFSIVWGEIAGFRSKNLSNPNYRLVSLAVSVKEYDACLEFCRVASARQLRFDDGGMWRAWLPPELSCGCCCSASSVVCGRTFCSKIITEALQSAGVREVQHLLPSHTTPSSLYSAIAPSSRVVCSGVPFKRQALTGAMRFTGAHL
jgi:hypothetical protein